jgi:hypothetical protein
MPCLQRISSKQSRQQLANKQNCKLNQHLYSKLNSITISNGALSWSCELDGGDSVKLRLPRRPRSQMRICVIGKRIRPTAAAKGGQLRMGRVASRLCQFCPADGGM